MTVTVPLSFDVSMESRTKLLNSLISSSIRYVYSTFSGDLFQNWLISSHKQKLHTIQFTVDVSPVRVTLAYILFSVPSVISLRGKIVMWSATTQWIKALFPDLLGKTSWRKRDALQLSNKANNYRMLTVELKNILHSNSTEATEQKYPKYSASAKSVTKSNHCKIKWAYFARPF